MRKRVRVYSLLSNPQYKIALFFSRLRRLDISNFIVLFISVACFYLFIQQPLVAQTNPYSIVLTDSIDCLQDYNYSKSNQDGSVTFYHITTTNGNINFSSFSLSPDFQFSTEEVFYSELLPSCAIRGYTNSFGYDYFYILSSLGSYCYVFDNQSFVTRIESSIIFGCYFLPTSANKVIYMDDDYFYRKDIITGTVDTLLTSSIEEPTGIWPYSNGKCLIEFLDPTLVYNLILLDSNFCIEDTIYCDNTIDNPIQSAIFEPVHATMKTINGNTIIFSPCIYWGDAITIFNEENDILYYMPGSGSFYDYVSFDFNSFLSLVTFGDPPIFGMTQTTITDNVFVENVDLDCIPIRFYSYNDSLFILINVYNQIQTQIGVSHQSCFPLFNQNQLYIDGYLGWYDISYWKLDYGFFLLAFHTNTSHRIKKFRIIDTTALEDEVEPMVALLKCYPNPFHDRLIIHLKDLQKITNFKIEVFNIKGQHIKSLNCNSQNDLIWDGTNKSNTSVSSGVYFLKIYQSNKHKSTLKVLFIK